MTPPPPAAAPSPAPPLDPAELAGHVAWVQRLARALVRDAAAAEDVAQETWRVTLAQPPGRVGGGARLRAWLGGVARRLALDRARSEASRAQRERSSARDASLRDAAGPHEPHEIVERSARQQRIVAAVMSLAEPYRSTVLYRYLDERPTRDVAERMAVSEEVVRKRLERGLAQLREQLDREFGAPTRQWAGLLIAGTGAFAMGAKAKAAMAAAVVIAASATTAWWWQHEARRSPDEGAAMVAPVEVEAAKPEVAVAPAPAAERRLDAERSPPTESSASEEAVAVIPIEVVTTDGTPCFEGRIFGFAIELDPARATKPGRGDGSISWGPDAERPTPRSFDFPITGATTELRLPAHTRRLLIAAAVPGHLPSGRGAMSDARSEEEARLGRPHRWSTRQIVVGAPLATPVLEGALLVDGKRCAPRGLVIQPRNWASLEEEQPSIRIDPIAASWSCAPRPGRDFSLWVTSDETVPRLFEVDADETTLDLELTRGRTLELTVLDRATGRIVPRIEVHATVHVITEKGLFRQVWDQHARLLRTGADGIARLVGLPDEGRVEIRRDDAMRKVAFEPSPKQPGWEHALMSVPAEPLLALKLEDDSGDVVRATIRVDVARPTRRLFGTVPAAFLERGPYDDAPAQLFRARVRDGETAQRDDDPIVPAADGTWEFDAPPDTTWLLWAERERRRVSPVERVAVAGDDVGPIAIEERGGTEVVVRVHRVPADGWLCLTVDDPGAVNQLGSVFACNGGTFERRLHLDAPTAVAVSWRKMRGGEGGDEQRRVVDPATTALVEFDLEGEGARDVVVESLHGGIASPATLVLVGVGSDGAIDLARRAFALLVDGRSTEPIALASGRWLWFVASNRAGSGELASSLRGVIAGVVDVPPVSVGVPLTLRAELDARPAADIGRGFTVESLAGVEIPAELRRLLQWTALGKEASDAPVLVPRDARIALREE